MTSKLSYRAVLKPFDFWSPGGRMVWRFSKRYCSLTGTRSLMLNHVYSKVSRSSAGSRHEVSLIWTFFVNNRWHCCWICWFLCTLSYYAQVTATVATDVGMERYHNYRLRTLPTSFIRFCHSSCFFLRCIGENSNAPWILWSQREFFVIIVWSMTNEQKLECYISTPTWTSAQLRTLQWSN